MDIEEDIRSLQLESAEEETNGPVKPEDVKLEEVDKSEHMDEDPKLEVQAEPIHVEPK
ncbi:hypothetical protein PIB30_057868, partial [Stylosanthes scabra]|nr:hypothetical protein [Stylosanthes scabra]